MKTEIYKKLKSKVLEMNNINDEVNLLEWNQEDGPKFDSVEEMKEFEKLVVNGGLDYLISDLENTDNNDSGNMIETFDYSLDGYFFYIYTFKKNDSYITYMTVKNLEEDYSIYNLCGNKSLDEKTAHSYFENLKNIITTNELIDILEHLLVGVENNIKRLKLKQEELISKS